MVYNIIYPNKVPIKKHCPVEDGDKNTATASTQEHKSECFLYESPLSFIFAVGCLCPIKSAIIYFPKTCCTFSSVILRKKAMDWIKQGLIIFHNSEIYKTCREIEVEIPLIAAWRETPKAQSEKSSSLTGISSREQDLVYISSQYPSLTAYALAKTICWPCYTWLFQARHNAPSLRTSNMWNIWAIAHPIQHRAHPEPKPSHCKKIQTSWNHSTFHCHGPMFW